MDQPFFLALDSACMAVFKIPLTTAICSGVIEVSCELPIISFKVGDYTYGSYVNRRLKTEMIDDLIYNKTALRKALIDVLRSHDEEILLCKDFLRSMIDDFNAFKPKKFSLTGKILSIGDLSIEIIHERLCRILGRSRIMLTIDYLHHIILDYLSGESLTQKVYPESRLARHARWFIKPVYDSLVNTVLAVVEQNSILLEHQN